MVVILAVLVEVMMVLEVVVVVVAVRAIKLRTAGLHTTAHKASQLRQREGKKAGSEAASWRSVKGIP